jgi:hypothetical protein
LLEVDNLTDKHFQRLSRLTRPSFEKLLNMIKFYVYTNEMHGALSSGSAISPRTRLYATLRWLAGGSYLDICMSFGVAYRSFFADGGVLWVQWML